MVSVDFDWANWKAHELDQFNTGLIGIDRIFDQFKQTQQNVATNYPPYNIVKVGEDGYKYMIEMAVAGHTMKSINITVEKQVLTVEGAGADKSDVAYIHKGISNTSFKRSFTLADTIQVKEANIVNGILYIELENVIPEADKPRTVKIGKSEPQLLLEKGK